MRTYLDCIPCFFKQALEAARLITGDENIHKQLMNDLSRLVPEFSLGSSPPEMSRHIHHAMEKYFGPADLYKGIKEKSNLMALELYPQLKEKVAKAQDRVLTAIEIAIAGNVIDYAAKNTLNIEEEIEKLLNGMSAALNPQSEDYRNFQEDLAAAKTIVYLADNAGELYFDLPLVKWMRQFTRVTYVVKPSPVQNDLTLEDLGRTGLEGEFGKVISTGVASPGIVFSSASAQFKQEFKSADLVLAKGMGHYEALSELPPEGRFFYCLMAKCKPVAQSLGVPLNSYVAMLQ